MSAATETYDFQQEFGDQTPKEVQFTSDLEGLILEGAEKANQPDSGWKVTKNEVTGDIHQVQTIGLTRAENKEKNESALDITVRKGAKPNDPIEEVQIVGKSDPHGVPQRWKIFYGDKGEIIYLARVENRLNWRNEVKGKRDVVYKKGEIPEELLALVTQKSRGEQATGSMSRRQFLALAGLATAAVALSACGMPMPTLGPEIVGSMRSKLEQEAPYTMKVYDSITEILEMLSQSTTLSKLNIAMVPEAEPPYGQQYNKLQQIWTILNNSTKETSIIEDFSPTNSGAEPNTCNITADTPERKLEIEEYLSRLKEAYPILYQSVPSEIIFTTDSERIREFCFFNLLLDVQQQK